MPFSSFKPKPTNTSSFTVFSLLNHQRIEDLNRSFAELLSGQLHPANHYLRDMPLPEIFKNAVHNTLNSRPSYPLMQTLLLRFNRG
jgi:hypothetical protein